MPGRAARRGQRDRMEARPVPRARLRGERPARRCGRDPRRRCAARRGGAGMSADWGRARRILCVRLDNMGDVLMTTPAMRALRESAPGRKVTLLASKSGAAIARHVPEIDAVIPYDAPW